MVKKAGISRILGSLFVSSQTISIHCRGPTQCRKGQEYDRVYIDPDVAASLSRPEAILTSASGDEANIAYLSAGLPVPLGRQAGIAQAGVGFTRAIRELHLPRDFKTILTPEWQETIERYE